MHAVTCAAVVLRSVQERGDAGQRQCSRGGDHQQGDCSCYCFCGSMTLWAWHTAPWVVLGALSGAPDGAFAPCSSALAAGQV